MVTFGETVERLYFSDLCRAVAFYAAFPGFSVVPAARARSAPGVRETAAVRRDQTLIWLNAAIPELVYPARPTFSVSDVDGLYAEFLEAGIATDGPPRTEEVDDYGGKMRRLNVVDPENKRPGLRTLVRC